MIVGSIKENIIVEKRVSITPETAKNILNLGLKINLEKNYAEHLGISDEDYNNLVNILDNFECKFILIDIANGYISGFKEFCKKIGGIDVVMDRNIITIRNGGVPIPVEKHSNGMWLPEFIFGTLRSSSNYNANDTGTYCGRNGFGAKLTNIFSKKFKVIVEDPEHKLRFTGIWKDNMFKDTPDAKPESETHRKRGAARASGLFKE